MYGTFQGRLPALGWNSWNAYGCAITEADVMTTVNLMVQHGLKAAGYEYVNRESAGHHFS
jgi:alpha-galactosidase